MRAQEAVCQLTEGAVRQLFRMARRTPADRLEWKPLDSGRTVLDMVQECAQAPLWYVRFLDGSHVDGWPPELSITAVRDSMPTLDDCERICLANTERFLGAVREVPDERLAEELDLGFPEPATVLDVLMCHYWNTTYHTGQIGYVQTLYGDMENF